MNGHAPEVTRLLSIVVPTYNEKQNIETLVTKVFEVLEKAKIESELIIVDDNSPDGTSRIVNGLKKKYPTLRILVRKDERGLSSAVLKGFSVAKGDILLVMDADMSHPPELIPKLVRPIQEGRYDVVFASRNVKGGGVEEWPFKRKLVSWGATTLAKMVTPVKDSMSGYFALKKKVIKGVHLNPKGYKIGLEILARGNYTRVKEVPFIFKDRKAGTSKMSGSIMWTYLFHVIGLLFAPRSVFRQFVKFCVVGAIGAVINLGILYLLTDKAGIFYIYGATISFCVAVTSNYIMNKLWTFSDPNTGTGSAVAGYVKFVVVSILGLAVNLTILYILVQYFHLWYILGQVFAIIGATIVNFLGSKIFVFTVGRPEKKDKAVRGGY